MDELDQLSKKKPPASVLLVYMALVSHDWEMDGKVFPSIGTIAEYINRPTRTVFWALSWLRENGFLVQSSPGSKERFSLVMRSAEMEKVQPLAQIRATSCTNSRNPLHSDQKVQSLAHFKEGTPDLIGGNVQSLALIRATPCTDMCNPLHQKKQRKEKNDSIYKPSGEFVERPTNQPQASNKKEKDWIPSKPKQNGSPKCPEGVPFDLFDWVRVCSPLVATAKICNLTPLRKNKDISEMLKKHPPPKNIDLSHLPRLIKSPDTIKILMRLLL